MVNIDRLVSMLHNGYDLDVINIIKDNIGLVDANFHIKTTTGEFFLKQFNEIEHNEYITLKQLYNHLYQKNIPVPRIITPLYPSKCSFDHLLFSYIEGTAYTGSISELQSVLALYNKIVTLSEDIRELRSNNEILNKIMQAELTLSKLSDQYSLIKEHSDILHYFQKCIPHLKQKLNTINHKYIYIPLHPDFTDRNLLFNADGSIALLCDWQGYGPRNLLYETADFINRFTLSAPFSGTLQPDRLKLMYNNLFKSSAKEQPELREYFHKYNRNIGLFMAIRQICNTPFRLKSYYQDNQHALMNKVIAWSYNFIQWLEKIDYDLVKYSDLMNN